MGLNINIGPTLLGDLLLTEPAMTAWADTNTPVNLWVEDPDYRSLLTFNPAINLVDEPFTQSDVSLSADSALNTALRFNLPFSAGYFPQFGMMPNPECHRLHYRLFGIEPQPAKQRYICLCRHSRSCSSQTGGRANKMCSDAFWHQIVAAFPEYVFYDVKVDGEPMNGTLPMVGNPLRHVAEVLNHAACVVSVDTGLLHLAGGIPGCEIVFLSSALPTSVVCPIGAAVVESSDPTEMSVLGTVAKIRAMFTR